MVARRVRCRSGRSTVPAARSSGRSSRSPSRRSSWAGGSSRSRAAASSSASGMPSSRRPSSPRAAAPAGSGSKPGRTSRARLDQQVDRARPAGSGASGSSCSARSRSAVRLVTRIRDGRAGGQQRGHVGRGRQHLLEVVQHQQHRPAPQPVDEQVEHRPAALRPDAERGRDRARHLSRVGDRGQVDEPHPVVRCRPRTAGPRTSSASRVLPIPPGPTSVTSRTPGRRQQVGDHGRPRCPGRRARSAAPAGARPAAPATALPAARPGPRTARSAARPGRRRPARSAPRPARTACTRPGRRPAPGRAGRPAAAPGRRPP